MAESTQYIDGANRIVPAAPAAAMQTYSLISPIETHFRPATCADANCEHHSQGWQTVIDETSPLGQMQAAYIRSDKCGRRFTESRDEIGMTVFAFAPGQTCFQSHQMTLDREPLYVVRGGDFRGNPDGYGRRHANAEDWVDDFASNLDANKTLRENG